MKRFIAVVMILLLLGLAGCGIGNSAPDKLVVTYVKSPLNVPTMVEKSLGIFADTFDDYGITVEYANITNGSEQTQALASGDVQFLFAVGAPSVILAAANGADIQVIGAYSSSPKAYQIVTGNDDIQSAADLKGRTVAGPKGTTLNELLVAYLAEDGVSVEEVNYLSMSISDAQAALEAGQVDAALLAGTNAYLAGQAGYRVLADGEGLIDGTVLVAAGGTFCERYPELVEAFLGAHQEVLAYMEQNPDTALEIAAAETGLDLQAVDTISRYCQFHSELTQQDIASIQKTMQFMLDNGMIEQAIDAQAVIYQPKAD